MKVGYWFVWCHNGGGPTYKHQTLESACAEAERLARLNPGEEFHVLKSVRSVMKTDVAWSDHSHDPDLDIPF